MPSRPYTTPVQLAGDHSLMVLGLGEQGQRIVDILHQDLQRLQLPRDRWSLFVWNPTAAEAPFEAGLEASPADGRTGAVDNLFEPFDAAAHLRDARHDSLRDQLAHLDSTEIADFERPNVAVPASGFLALHHGAPGLMARLHEQLDALRQSNPENDIRMLVVGHMPEGVVAGSLVPLVFHLQPSLSPRKVDLEVWLTCDAVDDDVQQRLQGELHSAAHVQQWQQVLLGDEAVTLPGTHGLREDREVQGPALTQVTLFHAGSETALQTPGAMASVVANNILAYEGTPMHKRLQEERDYHGEELLEQRWTNQRGAASPTRCGTFVAGGVKADCMPSILHLRTVRFFVEVVTRPLEKSGRDTAHAAARHCVEDARLGIQEIIHDLEVGRHPLTQDEVREAAIPKPQLHAYIKGRLDEDLGQLLALADQRTTSGYDALLEKARAHCDGEALKLTHARGAYLPAAVDFYRSLEKELHRLRDTVEERRAWAQRELGHSPSRDRLDSLLHRLESDLMDHGDNLHARFSETLTVALPIQIRKILEVAAEIREHALVVGTAPLLQQFYGDLIHACEKERESLQKLIFELTNAAAGCVRQEEQWLRTSRSAFTYQKGRFERLVDALWDRARFASSGVPVAAMVERLSGNLPALSGAADLEERLMDAARPEAERMAAEGEDIMAQEPLARQALQDAILQLHPTVELQRHAFGELQTLRRRFVACTRSFLHAHGDLLQDYQHIETTSPWNVWISEHEEGFPFEVVPQIEDALVRFLDGDNEEAAQRACATVQDLTRLRQSRS